MLDPMSALRAIPQRFWRMIALPSDYDDCWVWIGGTNGDGYGRLWFNGKKHGAHRFVYSLAVSNVDERTVDHLCRNRLCVNPIHLELVSKRENTLRSPIAITAMQARQTLCMRGHELSICPDGHRRCKICHKNARRIRKQAGAASACPPPALADEPS